MRYREDKATQAAAIFIRNEGGTLNHMKLIKLLYLAERAALQSWARPITFDTLVSMDHGPVLSITLDRINSQPNPKEPRYWNRFISERGGDGHELRLLREVPEDQLSPAEVELLGKTYQEFGQKDQWELEEYTHTLPEWRNPNRSVLPIDIAEILRAGDYTDEEIAEVNGSLGAESFANGLAD